MTLDPEPDTFDTIEGKHWLFNSAQPKVRYEVVSMLTRNGEQTDDPERAAGGVMQVGPECFMVFEFPTIQ